MHMPKTFQIFEKIFRACFFLDFETNCEKL